MAREHTPRRKHGSPQNEGSNRQPAGTQRDPWWQWLIAALGAVLLLGTAGYLGYRGFSRPHTPPAISVNVKRVQPSGAGYLVVVEATNHGGQTAAQVKVTGELRRAGELVGRSDVVFDYLPQNSPQRGGLFFEQDPTAAGVKLELDASGYAEP